MSSGDLSVKAIGYHATLLHGDASVLDRWFFLRRHLRPGALRTLDAGSGSGAMALHAARCGNQVLGISLSARDNAAAAERARILGLRQTEFLTGNLRDLRELVRGREPFDQVICFETIEHIVDDRKLLRDLAAAMKPGGLLILSAPYKHYHPLPGDKLSETEDGGHVRWGYTHEEMRELLEEAGFEMRAKEYVTGFFSQFGMRLQRLLVNAGAPGKLAWALTFPLRILVLLDPAFGALGGYPALSIGVTAIRK